MTSERRVLWMPPTWDLDRYRIIWVSVAKLNSSWQKEGPPYYPPPGTGAYFGRWLLAQSPRCRVKMPELGWGKGCAGFVNGRHRTAWLRDQGATALPVFVELIDDQTDVIAAELGTTERETWIRLQATEKAA